MPTQILRIAGDDPSDAVVLRFGRSLGLSGSTTIPQQQLVVSSLYGTRPCACYAAKSLNCRANVALSRQRSRVRVSSSPPAFQKLREQFAPNVQIRFFPAKSKGVPTDVEEMPIAECFDDTGRHRPWLAAASLNTPPEGTPTLTPRLLMTIRVRLAAWHVPAGRART